jgi:hypothetical protein
MKHAVWEICERIAEVQAILEDLETGKYRKNEVPFLINEILSEDGLREAMNAVGYLKSNVVRH